MKKTLSLILILSMFLCSNLSVFAMETTSTTSSTCNIYNDVESSGARIVHNYKKTITKVYKSRSSIPDSINYSEYNNSLILFKCYEFQYIFLYVWLINSVYILSSLIFFLLQ